MEFALTFLLSVPQKHKFFQMEEDSKNSHWTVRINQILPKLTVIYIPFSQLSIPTTIMTWMHAVLSAEVMFTGCFMALDTLNNRRAHQHRNIRTQRYVPVICDRKSL